MKMKHSNKFPIILKARNVLKMKWDYIVSPSFLCIKLEPPILEESKKDDEVYRSHVKNFKRFRSNY